MLTRCSRFAFPFLLVAVVALSGCAKRPATTQAAAPAPTGAATSTAAPPPSGTATAQPTTPGGSGATSGAGTATPAPAPAAPARPVPKDFAAVPDLVDVFFDFDKYDIRPADAKTLDANASWLKSNPNHLVLIEGHCDERGTNEYNLALGERRAKATRDYLVSVGIDGGRITVISYGEERPICAEKNEACWAKHRRAHFLVKQ
jgi:peptidoglycan-associated lipoprotein